MYLLKTILRLPIAALNRLGQAKFLLELFAPLLGDNVKRIVHAIYTVHAV